MSDETNLENAMPLTAAVRVFMEQQNWDPDELSISDSHSTVANSLVINEQKYRLYIETCEEHQRISVFLYTFFLVPRSRLDIVSRIFNRLHHEELLFGRLSCKEGPEPRPIVFRCGIDVNGGTLSPTQVASLVEFAASTFQMHGELLASACLTQRSLEELWAEHLAAEEEPSEWTDVKVPRLLN